jgi:hypothetical protein
MTAWLVPVLVLVAGCGAWRSPWLADTPEEGGGAEVRLEHARIEADAGRPKNAVVLYENVIREHPGEPVAAEALHDLAMLRLQPRSPVRDRRAAYQLLSRLAREHPKTQWGREARVWRVVLGEVDRCEAEATRLGADAERLRQTIESLKDADVDLEELP